MLQLHPLGDSGRGPARHRRCSGGELRFVVSVPRPRCLLGSRYCLDSLSSCLVSTQPFPYGTGAGYIFSNSVNAWLSTDTQVIKWVRDAAGATREELQWQKFEDTSTGYWLTYSPFTIEYMNVRALQDRLSNSLVVWPLTDGSGRVSRACGRLRDGCTT